MDTTIRTGDKIRIKPEWQDSGDEEFNWVAIEDEDGGRVRVAPEMDLPFPPDQVVSTDMIERV